MWGKSRRLHQHLMPVKGIRRSKKVTFVYTRNWQRQRAQRSVKCARKKPGFKGSYSNERYLGLLLLLVHADEEIKPALPLNQSNQIRPSI